jgi:hypothetical protein
MMSAVTAGLQAHKKAKKPFQDPLIAKESEESSESKGQTEAATATATGEVEVEDKLELVSTEGPSWLEVLSGDLVVYADGLVDGVDGFGTVAVPQAVVAVDGSSVCRWYYEVELVTGGLFQVKTLTRTCM